MMETSLCLILKGPLTSNGQKWLWILARQREPLLLKRANNAERDG